jgi:hypothetical protein
VRVVVAAELTARLAVEGQAADAARRPAVEAAVEVAAAG